MPTWPSLAATKASCYFHMSVTTELPMITQIINFSLIILSSDIFFCASLLLSPPFMTALSVILCYFDSVFSLFSFSLCGNPLAVHSPVHSDSSHGHLFILDPLSGHSLSNLLPWLLYWYDVLFNLNSALYQLDSIFVFYFPSLSITSMSSLGSLAKWHGWTFTRWSCRVQTLEAVSPYLTRAKNRPNPVPGFKHLPYISGANLMPGTRRDSSV